MKPLTEDELAKAIEGGHKALEEENKHKLENKQLAFMRNVRLGWDENSKSPGMQFDVRFSETGTSLQFLNWESLGALITAYKVYTISTLEDQPCWVYIDEDKGTVSFLGLCVMG